MVFNWFRTYTCLWHMDTIQRDQAYFIYIIYAGVHKVVNLKMRWGLYSRFFVCHYARGSAWKWENHNKKDTSTIWSVLWNLQVDIIGQNSSRRICLSIFSVIMEPGMQKHEYNRYSLLSFELDELCNANLLCPYEE